MRTPREASEVQAKREAILAKARTLFFRSGLAATTMPQIAKAAKVAPGTLYLYFPSKKAIYAALLIEGYDFLVEHLRTAVDSAASPEQQGSKLIDAFMTFAEQKPEYFEVLFFMVQKENHSHSQELSANQLKEMMQREAACKKVAAQVLLQAGHPADKVPAIVESVWTMLAGVIFFYRHDDDALPVLNETRRILLTALFPKS